MIEKSDKIMRRIFSVRWRANLVLHRDLDLALHNMTECTTEEIKKKEEFYFYIESLSFVVITLDFQNSFEPLQKSRSSY